MDRGSPSTIAPQNSSMTPWRVAAPVGNSTARRTCGPCTSTPLAVSREVPALAGHKDEAEVFVARGRRASPAAAP